MSIRNQLRGNFLAGQQFRVHADGQDFLIVRPVENADLAALRKRTRGSPQKIVLQFLGGRSLERIDLAALRIYSGHDVLDGAVFSRGVHGLQDHQNGPAILGIEFFLQFGEAGDPALERFFRVLFGLQAKRVRRIEILQAEMRSIRDLERLRKFA